MDRKTCMEFFVIKNIHPIRPQRTISEIRSSLYEIFKKYK